MKEFKVVVEKGGKKPLTGKKILKMLVEANENMDIIFETDIDGILEIARESETLHDTALMLWATASLGQHMEAGEDEED